MTTKYIMEQLLLKSSDTAVNGTRLVVKQPKPRLLKPGAVRKYPWIEIEVGQSFVANCTLESARVQAYNAGVRYGKKFRVVQHVQKDEAGTLTGFVIEIARIA